MSKKPKKHGPNKAKSIIAQPLFRCRQEQPDKGKGSYRREAFQSRDWEASYFWPHESIASAGMVWSSPDLQFWICACSSVLSPVGKPAS
ncbi:hypothetical protein GLGCALEP_05863 [Pseudomonas sp. MM221]|nr:hypothetical protein GLGCALEP_05863 [Pseudomonas sp. MM221]